MRLPHFSSNDLQLGEYANIGGFKMQGAAVEDFAGFNFGWADINGDGLSDLLVSSDGYDGGGLLAGGSFIIYGKQDGITPFIDFANLSKSDGFVIQGEFASDLAGRMLSSAGDVNGDGIEDMFIGAFKNDEGGYDSGAAYIIYGKADPFELVLDLYDLPANVGIKILGENDEDYASFWVSSAGDLNGDGRNDLILGAPQNDAGGTDSGAAYVIFGRDSNFPGKIDLSNLDPAAGFKITGAAPGDLTGYGVSTAGDINGDGFADLLVGAPQDGATGAGRAYVIYGKQDIGAFNLAQLTASDGFLIRGEANGDLAGFNVASAGDVNGDGIDDVIVGATWQDSGGNNAGAAYVIFGKTSGFGPTFDLTALDGTNGFKLQGAAAGDETGVCVAPAGDVNGDGYDDILVGAQFSNVVGTISGVAYLVFGKPGGFAPVMDLGNLGPRDGIRIVGEGAGSTTGRALSAAGDMNGDGYDDIAIGSPWDGQAGFKSGAAYVIYGRPDNMAPTAIGSRVTGVEDVAYVFSSVDFGFSDSDGDALIDVRIASLPARGILMLRSEDGSIEHAVVAGEIVSIAAIDEGRFYFIADANASGTAYSTFAFGVRDNGDIVARGEDASAATATMTIAVTPDSTDIDLIYGTTDNDILIGQEASAQFFGLAGDDVYIVNDSSQVAVEANGEGYDIVRTTADYTLASNSEIERLEAQDPGATTFIRLTGNEFSNYLRGNEGTNSLYGGGGSDTLEGLGGDDSYVVSTSADRVIEAIGGGRDTVYALGDYALTAGAEVETLLAYDRSLTTAQNLTGNEFNNLILGNQGNNIVIGGGGVDTMYGYRGDDIFYVDSQDDLPIEFYGEGYDIIISSVSYTMPQGMEFEVLRTIDPTATTAINLTGNKIPNIVFGNAGANILDGGGGGDILEGFGGDDVYVVRHSGDRVIEAVNGGYDTVRTLIDYTTGSSHVERIEAFDPTSTTALRLTGNALDNTMIGNAGANLFTGGAGADLLYGLGGDDAYIVADSRARVIEAVGGGRDTVYVTTGFTLEAGSEVEVLTVYDRATSDAITLTGNEFDNLIYGNAGTNMLIGGGGTDTLYGLGGDDIYVVDSAGDRIVEGVGGGHDTVLALASYSLATDAEIEVLAAFDPQSTVGLRLEGNSFAQRISGAAGNDSIVGGGGSDILEGLGGNDSYIVDDPSALVIEEQDGGYDTVYTTVSYRLAGESRVEVLSVYDRATTGALDLSGNDFDNLIYGNAGANRLGGGLGSDTLYGLGGADSFLFADALGTNNIDRLMDFQSGVDRLELDRAIFGGVSAGVLTAGAFALGTQAREADDRIIYDAATGALFYDADGVGGADAVQFATLNPHSSLGASDFLIV